PAFFSRVADWVAFALQDQRRGLDHLKVLDSKLVRFPDRMEWIAQADQPCNASFVGDKTGNPATHRFPADHQTLWSQQFNYFEPGFLQHGLLVWWLLLSCLPMDAHVKELKPSNAETPTSKPRGKEVHER